MTEKGWFVTRGAEPHCIHLGMLTAIHVPVVAQYVDDLKDSVLQVRGGRRVQASTEVSYGG